MPGIKCSSQLCSACTKVLHDQNYCKSKGSPAARHSTNWTFCTRHIRIVYFRNKRQTSNQQRNIFPYWFRVSLQFSSWLSIRDYSILKYRTPSIRAPSSIGKPSFSKNSVKVRPLEEYAPIFFTQSMEKNALLCRTGTIKFIWNISLAGGRSDIFGNNLNKKCVLISDKLIITKLLRPLGRLVRPLKNSLA